METQYLDTDPLNYTAQMYNHSMDHMINELDLEGFADEPRTGSDRSPMDQTTSVAGFLADYEIKNLSPEELGACEVDLRSLTFVDTPAESLLCAICAAPFITPMELGCSHVFCEECAYQHLLTSTSCPQCRRSVEYLKPCPKLFNQLLDELEAECPNKRDGCTKVLQRYTVTHHINLYCDYEAVACPGPDCECQIERRFVERGCLHTFTECEVCNNFIMEKDLEVSIYQNMFCFEFWPLFQG